MLATMLSSSSSYMQIIQVLWPIIISLPSPNIWTTWERHYDYRRRLHPHILISHLAIHTCVALVGYVLFKLNYAAGPQCQHPSIFEYASRLLLMMIMMTMVDDDKAHLANLGCERPLHGCEMCSHQPRMLLLRRPASSVRNPLSDTCIQPHCKLSRYSW